jgi:hypothetical protein
MKKISPETKQKMMELGRRQRQEMSALLHADLGSTPTARPTATIPASRPATSALAAAKVLLTALQKKSVKIQPKLPKAKALVTANDQLRVNNDGFRARLQAVEDQIFAGQKIGKIDPALIAKREALRKAWARENRRIFNQK